MKCSLLCAEEGKKVNRYASVIVLPTKVVRVNEVMDGKVPDILPKMVEAKYMKDIMMMMGMMIMTLRKQLNM